MKLKQPQLYFVIVFMWYILIMAAFPFLAAPIKTAMGRGALITSLTILNLVFITYFWLNGLKDVVYTIWYHTKGKKSFKFPSDVSKKLENENPNIELLYCTYNDFNPVSLEKSMIQEYSNYSLYILDDSTNPEYIKQVDDFVAKHKKQTPQLEITIVRRDNNIGYKAGNLNNHLDHSSCDYFVILDSDEVIPVDFITKSLRYFYAKSNIGIVQANHIATNNQNNFMDMFSIGVDSHWISYQTVKDSYGFLSLLGHGAMVRKTCYNEVGGFPHLVAEDLCFSIELRNKGYLVAFAPDIECHEEYPINYLAFKKRHNKWTQGNMEFIKKYTGRIITSKMTWFEKLDIVLFTYSLPLTFVFSLYLINNLIVLPLLGYDPIYNEVLLGPTILFLLAPMLNDVIFYIGKMNPLRLLNYLIHTILLYGSMFFVSLESSLSSVFGKAVFLVTPKTSSNIKIWDAIKFNTKELTFGSSLLIISTFTKGSVLPVILIAIPALYTVYLTIISNKNEPTSKPSKLKKRAKFKDQDDASKESRKVFSVAGIKSLPDSKN